MPMRATAPRSPHPALLATLGGALLGAGCAGAPQPAVEVPYVHPGSLVDAAEYAARRARLADALPDGAILVPGATAPQGSWRFFQASDFFYLTGVEAPGAWLLVDPARGASTLFADLDEHEALDEGLPLGFVLDPTGHTGIERARPTSELGDALAEVGRRDGVLHLSLAPEELARMSARDARREWRHAVTENPWDGRPSREEQLAARLEEHVPGLEIRDAYPAIQGLRKVKSPAEVALVREAARIAVAGHVEVLRSAEPALPERSLAALFEFVCRREGAQGLAYETILMSGPHHPYGHYHRHDRSLEEGDLVILDAGPDYAYYNADVSSTFPAGGRFTPEQRELYELGLGIRAVCLARYRPGVTLREVGAEVRAWLAARGYDADARRFRGLTTWGGYNHPIGLATHDAMVSVSGPDEPLEPGFVFACDINLPVSETLGVRIEDTVVITADGCENLSAGLPRTVAEIEGIMREPGLLREAPR